MVLCTFMYARDFLQEPAQCVENRDKGMITILPVSIKESVVDADFVDEQHRLSHKYQAARVHKKIGIYFQWLLSWLLHKMKRNVICSQLRK